MLMFKKILLYITFFIISIPFIIFASAPSFDDLWNHTKSYGSLWVSSMATFESNIKKLFFPNNETNGWVIWNALRYVAVWLLFVFILRAWALFLFNADDDGELKKAKNNLMYIWYWTFLVFGATWLLWSEVLNVWWSSANVNTVVNETHNTIIWGILIFFKTLAYYIAFIFMVYYGFKIMQAQEKEDKIKAWRTGIINIILALIAIKVLDYLYYIAQWNTFLPKANQLLVSTWKALGWILWVIIILALMYAAFLLFTSRWNEEAWKKSKTIIRNVFLVIFVLFLFILIVYDFAKNFSS
jgi:hypothetical protein